jgi:hypothetical protein
MIIFCTAPLLLLADAAVVAEGSAKPGQLFWGCLLVFGVYAAASVLFVWLISLFIGLFTKKAVILSEDSVTYDGKTLRLDDIRYITLYLPEWSRFHSKAQSLSLWADNKNYFDIQRPSIALIAALKKRCTLAAFFVDDWKGRLKMGLWVTLGVTAFGILLTLFGVE